MKVVASSTVCCLFEINARRCRCAGVLSKIVKFITVNSILITYFMLHRYVLECVIFRNGFRFLQDAAEALKNFM